MPKEEEKILEFTNVEKQYRASFVICADLQSAGAEGGDRDVEGREHGEVVGAGQRRAAQKYRPDGQTTQHGSLV